MFDIDAGRIYEMARSSYGALQKKLFRSGRALRPFSLMLVVTTYCNLSCEFCFLVTSKAVRSRRDEELSTDEWLSVVDQTPWWTVVTLTGGEPLLRPDFAELFERVASKRLAHVITNGTPLTDEICELFIESAHRGLRFSGLASVGISLEGGAERHDRIAGRQGAHDKTVAGIERLVSHRRAAGLSFPLIDLKLVMSEANYDDILEIAPIVEEYRPDYLTVQAVTGIEYACYAPNQGAETEYEIDDDLLRSLPPAVFSDESKYDAVLEQVRKLDAAIGKLDGTRLRYYPNVGPEEFTNHLFLRPRLANGFCMSPWTDLIIGPFGDACTCLVGTVGNVRDEKLKTLFNSEKFRAFRKRLREHDIFPACCGCCFFDSSGS
ncbi:MAG: radical SAM protein [Planctomycetota bacterium]